MDLRAFRFGYFLKENPTNVGVAHGELCRNKMLDDFYDNNLHRDGLETNPGSQVSPYRDPIEKILLSHRRL